MKKPKYYVLAYKTKADRAAGEYEYSFDCDTLAQAEDGADDEVKTQGMHAASIYERSGTTAPSVRLATHTVPQLAA